jgi:multidrug efflux pump subunit AcrA (membrane-fusion protein)
MRMFMLTPIVACRFALLPALIGMQAARVGAKRTEAKAADEATAAQPGLFTLSQDQLAHLRVVPVRRMSWPAAVHTTGAVDWDAGHTTPAITQVNGPIARILVDAGTPVSAGDPLLYVSSPDPQFTATPGRARRLADRPGKSKVAAPPATCAALRGHGFESSTDTVRGRG